MSNKVYVILAEGFEEIEAITPIDVLRRAELEVVTVSITDVKVVNGAHNIPIVADEIFDNIDFSDADIVFLPGGLPGAHNLNNHDGVKELLLSCNSKGKVIAAICAAPLVLGGLGLLKGQNATCYPGVESKLIGATIKNEACVVSQNIVTANGAGAAMKLALQLVSMTKGIELAQKLEKGMMFA